MNEIKIATLREEIDSFQFANVLYWRQGTGQTPRGWSGMPAQTTQAATKSGPRNAPWLVKGTIAPKPSAQFAADDEER
jgi:hypothetical protein